MAQLCLDELNCMFRTAGGGGVQITTALLPDMVSTFMLKNVYTTTVRIIFLLIWERSHIK